MEPKERVLTVLEHKKADRVPVTNRFTSEISLEISRVLNIHPEDSFDLEVELGHDLLCTKEIGIVNSYGIIGNKRIGDEYICDFQIVKKKVNYQGGFYLEIVKHPLENINDFYSYKFPDPEKQELLQNQYDNFKLNVEKYGKTHAIVGGVTCTILEGCEMLRGLDKVFMDFIENQDFLNELMDKLVNYHYKVGKKLIELGVPIIYIGDDVGMQTGMLISPSLWRKFLKPRYEYLFKEWRKINKNTIFALHSDGYIEPIIPDLIEIGLDILNPVQPDCGMDDGVLKKKYGKNISFWGGISVQKTIPFGSPYDVVNEVRKKIDILGENGGYIISSAHNIQPNLRSIDNTFIYYWACKKYGIYR